MQLTHNHNILNTDDGLKIKEGGPWENDITVLQSDHCNAHSGKTEHSK